MGLELGERGRLERDVRMEVGLGRLDRFMPKPQRDHRQIDTRLRLSALARCGVRSCFTPCQPLGVREDDREQVFGVLHVLHVFVVENGDFARQLINRPCRTQNGAGGAIVHGRNERRIPAYLRSFSKQTPVVEATSSSFAKRLSYSFSRIGTM